MRWADVTVGPYGSLGYVGAGFSRPAFARPREMNQPEACVVTREQQASDRCVEIAKGHAFAALSAASTRSFLNGTRRIRTPVASKIALATAAIIGLHDVSPAP